MRVLPVLLLLMLAACGGIQSPSQNQTETFTGTLAISGIAVHGFHSSNGEYHITLDSLTPQNTLLELDLVQGDCATGALVSRTFTAVSSVGISGVAINSAYCVALADSLNALQQPDQFTITISH